MPAIESFLDTNTLLYSISTAPAEAEKTSLARGLIRTMDWAWSPGAGGIAEFRVARAPRAPPPKRTWLPGKAVRLRRCGTIEFEEQWETLRDRWGHPTRSLAIVLCRRHTSFKVKQIGETLESLNPKIHCEQVKFLQDRFSRGLRRNLASSVRVASQQLTFWDCTGCLWDVETITS